MSLCSKLISSALSKTKLSTRMDRNYICAAPEKIIVFQISIQKQFWSISLFWYGPVNVARPRTYWRYFATTWRNWIPRHQFVCGLLQGVLETIYTEIKVETKINDWICNGRDISQFLKFQFTTEQGTDIMKELFKKIYDNPDYRASFFRLLFQSKPPSGGAETFEWFQTIRSVHRSHTKSYPEIVWMHWARHTSRVSEAYFKNKSCTCGCRNVAALEELQLVKFAHITSH